MTKHSIENKAIIYTYSIIYEFSYKYYLYQQIRTLPKYYKKSLPCGKLFCFV